PSLRGGGSRCGLRRVALATSLALGLGRRLRSLASLALLLLGLRLLLQRAKDQRHVAALLVGSVLHHTELGDILSELHEQAATHFGAGLLTTTEHDRHLDLVATLEEADNVTLLGLVVVVVDLETETHLLDLGVRLVATRLTRLDCGFVLELAVVHELRDRGSRIRRHLDKVKVRLLCKSQCVLDADDANLLTLRTHEADLGDADALIDA